MYDELKRRRDEKSLVELATKAKQIWISSRRGARRLTPEERGIMRSAYWSSVLPKDRSYSLSQWVEDGMPEIV